MSAVAALEAPPVVRPAACTPPLACIWLPALPLQLLARRAAAAGQGPLAVLQGEQICGPLQRLAWVNAAAAQAGVEVGMPLRAAQGLCLALRAEVVPEAELRAAMADLWALLLHHSPRVEPATSPWGLLWADPQGLGPPQRWQQRLQQALQAAGWRAKLRLGFSRTFCRALLQADATLLQAPCATAAVERRAALQVALSHLDLSPALQAALQELGLCRLGDVLRLPEASLRLRLGPEAAALYRGARHSPPLRPLLPQLRCEVQHDLEVPTAQAAALLFLAQALLPPLLQQLQQRGEAAVALQVQMRQGRGAQAPQLGFVLRAAQPTLELRLWLELLRLRLQQSRLQASIRQVCLRLQGQRRHGDQASLLPVAGGRDLQAAAQAIRRVQAALGPASTTCARLQPEHLPELQFVWQPIDRLALPRQPVAAAVAVQPASQPQLMRQWVGATRRQSLDALQRRYGKVCRWFGPFRLSHSRWWEAPVSRDYYYALTVRHDLLWLYRDAAADADAQPWVLQGIVD